MTLLSRIGQSGSSTLPAFNWATKPAPADYSGRLIRIADVGVHGSIWFSDGTRWIHESPIILQQASKGWLVPSLAAADAATYSQAGTTITVTSVGHNIPATEHDGKDVYLAISSGDAVAGWFSNFTRTGADTFTCESAVSQTTSGSVNTNTAETTITELTTPILGGLMGANGALQGTTHFTCNASSGVKTLKWKFDGVVALRAQSLSTTVDNELSQIIKNKEITKQVLRHFLTAAYLGNAASSTPCQYIAVNTNVDISSSVTLQVTGDNNFIALESFLLEVRPS
jgi:hypothetical protein